MTSIPDYLKGLSESQLMRCHELAGKMIKEKREEAQKIVWRVCSGGIVYGNFRSEDYLKAAEFLAEHAKKMWAEEDHDSRDLFLEIVGQKVPESEYESFFD